MHYRRWHLYGDPLLLAKKPAPKRCAIPGCERPHSAKGWCGMHYRRWERTGDPSNVITVTHGTAEERFRRFVRVDVESGCWLWTGSTKGLRLKYPQFNTGPGHKESYAHRWSYQHFKGPIPDGMHVDHLCHQPLCVNPEHLETVTPTVNNQRRRAPLGR